MTRLALFVMGAAACASSPRPFPFRAPMVVDTDTRPVSLACRPEPTPKEPGGERCAPEEYISPFVWDNVDNSVFAPMSRALSIEVSGEAANATSLDEVADSSWFDNRIGARPLTIAERTLGACTPDDVLPDDVADGAWTVDHGKNNGSTLGFRVSVPGKGLYMLKADDLGKPERASAASVIGAAFYNAAGFSTTCEQVVLDPARTAPPHARADDGQQQRRDQRVRCRRARRRPRIVDAVGGRVRMQASKWLPGLPIGPFRYMGDARRRSERRDRSRGSSRAARQPPARRMAESLGRTRTELDGHVARDRRRPRCVVARLRAPLHPRHQRRARRGGLDSATATPRLGPRVPHGLPACCLDFVHARDRSSGRGTARTTTPGREKFGLFSARDFDPERGAAPTRIPRCCG